MDGPLFCFRVIRKCDEVIIGSSKDGWSRSRAVRFHGDRSFVFVSSFSSFLRFQSRRRRPKKDV